MAQDTSGASVCKRPAKQNQKKIFDEMMIGGITASFACLFTNPFEIAKLRLQMQGELQQRGTYSIIYKNVVQTMYAIAKSDGLIAFQRGLIAHMLYQFMMQGSRLMPYQIMTQYELHLNKNGDISYPRTLLMSAVSGAFGAAIGSPLFLIKTHQQVYSTSAISVGFQRKKSGLLLSLNRIYREHGLSGLWRGWQAQVIRGMTGSGAQLATVAKLQELLHKYDICQNNNKSNIVLASVISGAGVTAAMAPLDTICIRISNQPLDKNGKGLYYSGIIDTLSKVIEKEGFLALYKGTTGLFFRLTPHTIITVFSWDVIRQYYYKFK